MRQSYTIIKRIIELIILGAILCLSVSCSDNLPDGTVEDPNTGQPMIVGSIVLDDLKKEPFEDNVTGENSDSSSAATADG